MYPFLCAHNSNHYAFDFFKLIFINYTGATKTSVFEYEWLQVCRAGYVRRTVPVRSRKRCLDWVNKELKVKKKKKGCRHNSNESWVRTKYKIQNVSGLVQIVSVTYLFFYFFFFGDKNRKKRTIYTTFEPVGIYRLNDRWIRHCVPGRRTAKALNMACKAKQKKTKVRHTCPSLQ